MAEYSSKKAKRVIGGTERGADDCFLITQCHHMNLIEGKLFVSEMLSHRVKVFEAEDGKFVRSIGELGFFDGEFDVPAGATYLEGSTIICDLNNGRLQAFDKDGEFEKEIGSKGDGPGCFGNPYTICVDPKSKNVFVAEAVNKRVQVLDKDFNHVKFITERAPDVKFTSCSHVSFDINNNRVIVTDAEGSDVTVFDATTGDAVCSLQGEEGEFSSAARTAADKDGNILVCEMGKNKVVVFDQNGKKIGPFAEEHDFSYPEDIAIADNGDIYILEGNCLSGWNKITIF